MTTTPTPEQLEDMSEHLDYEVWMLNHAVTLIQGLEDGPRKNAAAIGAGSPTLAHPR